MHAPVNLCASIHTLFQADPAIRGTILHQQRQTGGSFVFDIMLAALSLFSNLSSIFHQVAVCSLGRNLATDQELRNCSDG